MNKRRLPQRQAGAALITALIFLVILTMLALSSMNTNTLEERMAANSQETNRAFQTAETGLQLVFNDETAFNPANDITNPYEKTITDIGGYQAETQYKATFREQTIPPRGSGWDSTMAFYHFDLQSTGCFNLDGSGCANNRASDTVHGGAYQVGKGS